MSPSKPVEPFGTKLTTKSGNPVYLGTGSGTKWQKIKKARDASLKDTLVDELVDNLVLSVKNGFRHLDTAEIYTTHPEIAEAIKKSGVPREDLFITTKYNPGVDIKPASHKSGAESVDAALKELDVDYIDLFLVHFPFFNDEYSHGQSLEKVWADLIQAKKDGKVRYIGGSNFAIEHLKQVSAIAGGDPNYSAQVNQIEFHPYLQDQSEGIRDYAKKNGVLLEAYGPLSPLFRIIDDDGNEVVDHPLKPVIPKLAEKYGKTSAQILLRYTLQKGLLPITTSSQSERQKEALAVYEFALEDDDVKLIDDVGSQFHFRGFFKNLYHTKD
ncbi:Aldo/keto reductase [Metschnikowia aff. pulcherrima]|uniref:2-dehydropantolactone reductase n=1 Tax=Metschnikowia aff. pulcherrima TaxID=2163413 RepID=A0A4P6XSX0_9ASCO|nr:Aldo/keto reductase [Metschnikowia aff. pulcherrima]